MGGPCGMSVERPDTAQCRHADHHHCLALRGHPDVDDRTLGHRGRHDLPALRRAATVGGGVPAEHASPAGTAQGGRSERMARYSGG